MATRRKPKKSSLPLISKGGIVAENLPFPVMHYPGLYGAFFAFAEDKDSPPKLCSCSMRAAENYITFRARAIYQDLGRHRMKNRIMIALFVLLVAALACGGGGQTNGGSSGGPPPPKTGWLCDYDRTGSIRLWTAASMDATVKDVVGTCVGCCVDVTMHDETLANRILFYRIRVGSQSGWVDVDYFYWTKPAWSTN